MAFFQASRKVMRPMAAAGFAGLAGCIGTHQMLQAEGNFEKKYGFALGPVNAMQDVPKQGWQLATKVGQSTIAAAGNGRYAAEPLKAGKVVVAKIIKPMATLDSLLGLSNDTTITFASVADLEKYIDLAKSEGGYSRQEILTFYEHFMYGIDGKVTCLNTSTWTVNHGEAGAGMNVLIEEKPLPGGELAYVGTAQVDIIRGDELYNDYRLFKIADFYTAYTQKHGYKDVRTATLEAVYGPE